MRPEDGEINIWYATFVHNRLEGRELIGIRLLSGERAITGTKSVS